MKSGGNRLKDRYYPKEGQYLDKYGYTLVGKSSRNWFITANNG